ncbi:Uncharacterized protein HZ326_10718 [Fusarium oxysporum f. sp. albedinis]|nr:Uncharacterized protein HZ326_10718 [Fusarium oxysporum f. sp. albedinis]
MSTSRTGLELRVDSYQFFNIVHLIRAVTDSIMRSKLYFYDLVQGIIMENSCPQSSCSPMSVSLDPFLFGMKHCAIESRLWGLPFFRFFWRSETYEHLAWCPIRQTTSIKYFMSLNTIDLQKGC